MGVVRLASLLAATFSLVASQTPQGYIPEVQGALGIAYNGQVVPASGQQLPRTEVMQPPLLNIEKQQLTQSQAGGAGTKGIVMMIDIDVPRNGSRTTLLHWLSPDVDLAQSPAAVTSTQGTPYAPPNPPAGDSPHRYVFLMFAQPEGFTIPPSFSNINPPTSNRARVNFDVASFAAQSGLQLPIAASYIMVKSDQEGTNTFPPLAGETASSSINGTVVMTSLAPEGAPAPTATATGGNTTTGNAAISQIAPIGFSFFGALLALLA